ncbi:hypothetical protein AKJ54_00725 [candidate division MSBL1 archaeon SCGC-AAA382K21]|uniref:CARDB domain-containing protein n=1 Tax=candidate division MSBL1 archaeon SCGC-AAA382K21 TaxID=1698283 RepID=A0A133VL11_9EURY|nr:hypothetical protein AKJ54_00725 [candidate division MSBL1 archaeon SCGC-AAA382K21]
MFKNGDEPGLYLDPERRKKRDKGWSDKKKIGIGIATATAILAVIVSLYVITRPEPNFQVKSLSLSSTKVGQGESVTAQVKVANVGGAEGTYTVNLEVEGETLEEKVTLSPDESKTVSFDIAKEEKGTYNLRAGSSSKSFVVVEPAEFEVSNLNLSEEEVEVDEKVDLSVDVSNVGEKTGAHAVKLLVNGEPVDSEEVEVEGGDTETVTFEISREEAGTYNIKISDLTQSFEVLEPAEFEVSNLQVSPKEVEENQRVEISVDVKNSGEVEGTKTLDLNVDGSIEKTKDITLEGEENTTVSFSIHKESPKSYSVGIEDLSGSFRVLEPAEFEVSNLSVNSSQVEPGEPVTVSIDVTNTGDLSGDYTIELKIDGTMENSKTVTVDGGKNTTVSFTIEKETSKTYSVEVGNLSQSFEILAPAEFELSNLQVSPSEVGAGGAVEISVDVQNVGEITGEYTVSIKINGETEHTKKITLAGG